MRNDSTSAQIPTEGERGTDTSRRKTKPSAFLYVLIVIVMALWGFAFVGIKALLDVVGPIELTVLRFFFVLLVVAPYVVARALKGSLAELATGRGLARFFVYGLVGVVAYHLSLNVGEQYTSAVVASIIVFTAPVFTLIFSKLLLEETITLRKSAGILVALTGAVIVALEGESGGTAGVTNYAGAALVFLAPVSWALYTVLGKRYQQQETNLAPLDFSAATLTTGSILLMTLARPTVFSALAHFSAVHWVYLLTLSLLCSVFGYVVWFFALEVLEAGALSAFLYLIPIFSQIFAWALFGERMTASIGAGMLLVFAGIYLIERRERT